MKIIIMIFMVLSSVLFSQDSFALENPFEFIVEIDSQKLHLLENPEQGSLLSKLYESFGQPEIENRFSFLGKNKTEYDAHYKSVSDKFSNRYHRRIKNIQLNDKFLNTFRITFHSEIDILEDEQESIIEAFKSLSDVKKVDIPQMMKLNLVPNDPFFSSSGNVNQNTDDLWGLKIIDVEQAWNVSTGNPNLVIAVIDSGLDLQHAEIVNNTFVNQAELNGSPNVDDDGNGFIDDINGINTINFNNDVDDDHGHGTHVAGIISAQGNNNLGVSGVMWDAKILPIKACDSNGLCNTSDVADAIIYATDMGAEIINLSLGHYFTNVIDLELATLYAVSQGVFLVSSSGNDNTEEAFHYPSTYPHVFSVGASTHSDNKAGYSNYGVGLDMVAPGGRSNGTAGILSLRASNGLQFTDPSFILQNDYYIAKGTSMATPFVTGTIGLILSLNSSYTIEEVRQMLRNSADDVDNTGWDQYTGYGRLNANKSVMNASQSSRCEALITSPKNLTFPLVNLNMHVDIEGIASGQNFGHYVLRIADEFFPVNGWTVIQYGSNSISNGVLGSVPVSNLSKSHSLKLTVFDQNGQVCGEDRRYFNYGSTIPDGSYVEQSQDYRLGYKIASGDVNGDGYDDILMGAPNCEGRCADLTNGFGKAFISYGGNQNYTNYTIDMPVANMHHSWISYDTSSRLGMSVDIADINHDGFDDVILGAPGTEDNGPQSGKVCVFLGNNFSNWHNDMNIDNADFCFLGAHKDAAFGAHISTGDFDHDHHMDIAVSSCGVDEYKGAVYIIYGADWQNWNQTDVIQNIAGTTLTGEHSNNFRCTNHWFRYGDWLRPAGVGDVNGDKYDDLVISSLALTPQDGAYLFYGSPSRINSTSLYFADYRISNWIPNNVAIAGDVNDDNYFDILVGTDFTRQSTHVLYGNSSLNGFVDYENYPHQNSVFQDADAFEYGGYSLNGVADLTGDGIDDFAIGAYGFEGFGRRNSGAVWVVPGHYGGIMSDYAISATPLPLFGDVYTSSNYQNDSKHFGYSITSGDYNGDGHRDIAVSSALSLDIDEVFFFYGPFDSAKNDIQVFDHPQD